MAESLPPLFHDVLALKVLVSQPAYCFTAGVESEPRQADCQQRLRKRFALLQSYEAKCMLALVTGVLAADVNIPFAVPKEGRVSLAPASVRGATLIPLYMATVPRGEPFLPPGLTVL